MSSNEPTARMPGTGKRRVLKPDDLAHLTITPPQLSQLKAPHDELLVPLANLLKRSPVSRARDVDIGAPHLPAVVAHGASTEAKALQRRAVAVLKEAEETGAQRKADAEQQVERMLNEAVQAANAIATSAQESGFDEGYAAGFSAGQAQADTLRLEAEQQADALRADAERVLTAAHAEAVLTKEAMFTAAEGEMLDLSLTVARQVMRAELTARPEAALPMLQAALTKLRGESMVTVRVSPTVAAAMAEQQGPIPGLEAGHVTIQADSSLEPGDFFVNGEQGRIDGRLDRQVALIHRELTAEG